jgi:ubiquinol-cytochrome c reductase cytochrome b subunit
LLNKHIISYCINISVTISWSIGYSLVWLVIINGIVGCIISLHITIDYYKCYVSIYYIVNDIYYGYTIINIHSYSTSILYINLYLHIIRTILYLTYYYNYLICINGFYIVIISYWLSYCGYVMPCCQLSIWGLIVISNVINICWLINYILGCKLISNINNEWTIKRFYIYHVILYIILIVLIVIHIIYLHTIGSSNVLGISINNYSYLNVIIINDIIGYNNNISVISLVVISCYQFTNTYNNIEVIELLITPLHICPEWYFLHLYIILKVIPNKYDGINYIMFNMFIILVFSEYRIINYNIRIISYTNYYSNQIYIMLLSIYISILSIGIQLINNIMLSYGRIFICLLIIFILLLY